MLVQTWSAQRRPIPESVDSHRLVGPGQPARVEGRDPLDLAETGRADGISPRRRPARRLGAGVAVMRVDVDFPATTLHPERVLYRIHRTLNDRIYFDSTRNDRFSLRDMPGEGPVTPPPRPSGPTWRPWAVAPPFGPTSTPSDPLARRQPEDVGEPRLGGQRAEAGVDVEAVGGERVDAPAGAERRVRMLRESPGTRRS